MYRTPDDVDYNGYRCINYSQFDIRLQLMLRDSA